MPTTLLTWFMDLKHALLMPLDGGVVHSAKSRPI
eukprot:CAMPEP_0198538452 /NCGR_PEP_ID=MMETSP1462-20131121/47883_1 /TAXON_ID=1333877 /ORGANISM="Brandtodinium nutriculum, Strain RCC3387" /LENGTH=33 /DNA_ID= /DNA_START= /DNA_END= /DNA_ORIENTATION=